MRHLIFALLLFASLTAGQDNKPAAPDSRKPAKGQVTVEGCVSRSNGDYVLFRTDPGVSYELEAGGKVRLHSYLGQRVEVTGQESASMSTSSDVMMRAGSASPVTIKVSSIKMIEKECSAR